MNASTRAAIKPLVVLLAAVAVAACGGGGAESAGPVPTVPSASASARLGFIGLPPKGATRSTPRTGELVASWWGNTAGDWGKSRYWVFADGRLISLREADIPEGANPGFTGFLEQRLTPEGVELLDSEVVGSDMPLVPRDLTSGLPARAWADRTITAYVPSRYAVCSDGTARELKHLWSTSRPALRAFPSARGWPPRRTARCGHRPSWRALVSGVDQPNSTVVQSDRSSVSGSGVPGLRQITST